jgi:hypothetical protein
MRDSRLLTTLWASKACYRDSFTPFFKLITSSICGEQDSLAQTDDNLQTVTQQLNSTLSVYNLAKEKIKWWLLDTNIDNKNYDKRQSN